MLGWYLRLLETEEAHERGCESRRTPHFALLAVLPIQYAQGGFSCLFVVIKTHIGWKLQRHLACADVNQSFVYFFGCHVPKGPTISSGLGSSVITTSCFRLAGGSRSRRSTPSGIDNGALPIRDRHFDVLEKGLDPCGEDKAGTRKSGSITETFPVLARRQLDLNIMMSLYVVMVLRCSNQNERSEVSAKPR